MANVVKSRKEKKDFKDKIIRLFQSGNLNFILGSGASYPAIAIAGNIEKEIQTAIDTNQLSIADDKVYELLKGVQEPFKVYLQAPIPEGSKTRERKTLELNAGKSLKQYSDFISNIENILIERKGSLIPKQANIFTTNYDLFLEKASEQHPSVIFNDGFLRTPNIAGWHEFSSKSFFNSTFNKGNLYNYKVELPSINFIKIHGSLSWNKIDDKIFWTNQIKEDENPVNKTVFNSKFSLILPRRDKFNETIMDRTYYDLLRIYANELDKEGTLLVAFGFSFLDEHIRDITLRALKNPTLNLLVFAYDHTAEASLATVFDGYTNVHIFCPNDGEFINFDEFNRVLNVILNPTDEAEDDDEN